MEAAVRNEETEAGSSGEGDEAGGGQAHCTDGIRQVDCSKEGFWFSNMNLSTK